MSAPLPSTKPPTRRERIKKSIEELRGLEGMYQRAGYVDKMRHAQAAITLSIETISMMALELERLDRTVRALCEVDDDG